ncbi:uncharacterized protein CDAR_508841 [Caerostris darwini]|uniref:Uncharacterized protein n=1 Tax=Caerostris darwini TaxID=1538125 RepID=A0AAV4N1N3_9ARAC|nr:uncharacterized protein CDAR_508841 [Caerostris darwini]
MTGAILSTLCENFTILELLDLSLRVPEVGAINFNLLHTVLSNLIIELQLDGLKPKCYIQDVASAQAAVTKGRMEDPIIRGRKTLTPAKGFEDIKAMIKTADLKRIGLEAALVPMVHDIAKKVIVEEDLIHMAGSASHIKEEMDEEMKVKEEPEEKKEEESEERKEEEESRESKEKMKEEEESDRIKEEVSEEKKISAEEMEKAKSEEKMNEEEKPEEEMEKEKSEEKMKEEEKPEEEMKEESDREKEEESEEQKMSKEEIEKAKSEEETKEEDKDKKEEEPKEAEPTPSGTHSGLTISIPDLTRDKELEEVTETEKVAEVRAVAADILEKTGSGGMGTVLEMLESATQEEVDERVATQALKALTQEDLFTGDPANVIQEMWRAININRRVDGAEEGLRELSAIVDAMLDKLHEMETIVSNSKSMFEQLENFVERIENLESKCETLSIRIDESVSVINLLFI